MDIFAEFRYQYCIFCRTGSEHRIADDITQKFGIKAIVPIQEKNISVNGHNEIGKRVFLPGYIFLYTNTRIEVAEINKIHLVYKVLKSDNRIFELMGSDAAFAIWLLKHNGLVKISKVKIRNGKFQVMSGPLQDMCQQIIKINKHTKNALVRMHFLNREVDRWFAFMFDDDYD